LELLGERNVLAQFFARVFKVKPVAGIRPPKFHWDQNQRSAAKLFAVVFLSPGKHAQRQIQSVYTLFLHRSSRRMIRGKESILQLRRRMGGLKTRVLMSGCAVA